MRKQIIAPLAAGVLLALAGAAQAATKTASFTVSATVSKNCFITAGALTFLEAFEGDNDLDQTSNISVRCTLDVPYEISLSAGGSGDHASRRMTGPGGDLLFYNLYTTDLHAAVWGDGSPGTVTVGDEGEGMGIPNTIVHTVHGRVLASDNAGPIGTGAYSDTIVATITY
jgi:spore coat protein U-like protein